MTRVSRDVVVALLRNRGDFGAAARAEAELPDEVSERDDAELLEAYGIEAAELHHARRQPEG